MSIRLHQFMTVVLLTTSTGCDPGRDAEGADRAWVAEPGLRFSVPRVGKADGAASGFLDDEALARVELGLEQAIASTALRITALESAIASLEQRHALGLNEINELVRQIEARKRELEDNLKAKASVSILAGLAGLAFGLPVFGLVSAGSLASAIKDDSRIRDLQSRLRQAQALRDQIALELQTYRQRREALATKLAALRAAKVELLALLAGEPPAPVQGETRPFGASAALDEVHWRLGVMRRILANNHAQLGLLSEVRALAVELAAVIDQALETVRAVAAAADEMLADSDDELSRLAALAVAPDPGATALAWLEDLVAARTRELLAHYDRPVVGFVEFLLAHRTSTLAEVAADLRERLVDRILSAVLPQPADAGEAGEGDAGASGNGDASAEGGPAGFVIDELEPNDLGFVLDEDWQAKVDTSSLGRATPLRPLGEGGEGLVRGTFTFGDGETTYDDGDLFAIEVDAAMALSVELRWNDARVDLDFALLGPTDGGGVDFRATAEDPSVHPERGTTDFELAPGEAWYLYISGFKGPPGATVEWEARLSGAAHVHP
jgi:hypothetical protein